MGACWRFPHTHVQLEPINVSLMVAQTIKNPPATQETRVRSLGQDSALEKGRTTHCSSLAWRILWTEDPGSPWGFKERDMTEQLTLSLSREHA